MDSSLHPPTRQPFLTQAEEDAKKMQKIVVEKCNKKGVDPPKYVLKELIGKGSFGRVYKAYVSIVSCLSFKLLHFTLLVSAHIRPVVIRAWAIPWLFSF